MQTTTVKLYTLGYTKPETYLAASLFVLGNIALPQIFHLMPQGGIIWLPIYFFTLIGAYKYGWKVGLLTAVFSPVVNSFLFGMPLPVSLPAILLKSVLLAVSAGYVAHRYDKVSISLLLGTVLFYQLVGTLGEWGMKRDFYLAVQDFRIGIPGMLLQVFGGYVFIKYLIRK
ncbi:ECF transporter S component [Bacteroides sp. HPS0048]|uniref:ECF transporter S component n=1 Tax=Bacteroides sp. HPS0048 TaxID=1078089 RepID=UPI00356331FB